jgi:levanase/fructan beta-fructosidase
LRLGQVPILSERGLSTPVEASDASVLLTDDPTTLVTGLHAFDCTFDLTCSTDGCASIDLCDENGPLAGIIFDRRCGVMTFERKPSLRVDVPAFSRRTEAVVLGGARYLRILVDGPLVEVFVDQGKLVYTATVFPAGIPTIVGRVISGNCYLRSVVVNEIRQTMFKDNKYYGSDV